MIEKILFAKLGNNQGRKNHTCRAERAIKGQSWSTWFQLSRFSSFYRNEIIKKISDRSRKNWFWERFFRQRFSKRIFRVQRNNFGEKVLKDFYIQKSLRLLCDNFSGSKQTFFAMGSILLFLPEEHFAEVIIWNIWIFSRNLSKIIEDFEQKSSAGLWKLHFTCQKDFLVKSLPFKETYIFFRVWVKLFQTID